jgi:hypothetical protein
VDCCEGLELHPSLAAIRLEVFAMGTFFLSKQEVVEPPMGGCMCRTNVKPGGKPFKAPAMSPRMPVAVRWANNSGIQG